MVIFVVFAVKNRICDFDGKMDEKWPTRPLFVEFEESGLKIALKGRFSNDEKGPTRAFFVEFEEVSLNFALYSAKFGGRKSAYTALFRKFRGGRPKFCPLKGQNLAKSGLHGHFS